MTDLASAATIGATVDSRPIVRRRKKRITGRSIAVIVFLAICALFFCVPLYVVLTTSLKTMDEIRQGQIFALPQDWTLEAWRFAWFEPARASTATG